MLTFLLYAAALPLEFCALFSVWNWSRRRRSPLWLVGSGVIIISLVALLMLVDQPFSSRLYLGFAGMYVFSRLAWEWIVNGSAPEDWKFGKATMAFLAVGMFALANSDQ